MQGPPDSSGVMLRAGDSSRQFDSSGVARFGYSVWQYIKGGWTIIKSRCYPGADPGGPPPGKGRFEGEIVRKGCVPSPQQQKPPGTPGAP
jgi:hypothetical protein